MSKDTVLEIITETNKDLKPGPLDPREVEKVFGTPTSPKHEVQRTGDKNEKDQHDLNKSEALHASEPLLEPDRERQKPPLAGPEVDDLDDGKPADATPYPGIDDGLLEPVDKKPHGHDDGEHSDKELGTHDDGVGTDGDEGKWLWPAGAGEDLPDYPYDGHGFHNGLTPRFGLDDRPGSPIVPGSIPDVNTYQQKKNLAQGMMDLALLSANANQLRYVLESSTSHPYFYPSLAFITISIVLQIAVGVGLIMNSRYDVNDKKDICKADKINNMTVLGVFLVTIVNVFITSFSVATPNVASAVGPVTAPAG